MHVARGAVAALTSLDDNTKAAYLDDIDVLVSLATEPDVLQSGMVRARSRLPHDSFSRR